MEPDISTLYKPDILILRRQAKEFQLKAPMCSHHEIAAKKGRVLW
jgi:hypothetical protein